MRSEMLGAMAKMGVKVEKHHHDMASAQHQLGMKFDTMTLMADQMQIYKYCIHQVAHIYGKTATFMPKPVYGDNGSGMHCHQSIWKDGKPVFAGNKYADLSEICLHYIGGIIKHAKAINAFILRRQVGREPVVQAVDDALERALLDLLVADRLVEVVLDVVDDLGAQGAVLVHERVADRAREGLGVAAEPDAADQQQHAGRDQQQGLTQWTHGKRPHARPRLRVESGGAGPLDPEETSQRQRAARPPRRPCRPPSAPPTRRPKLIVSGAASRSKRACSRIDERLLGHRQRPAPQARHP